VVAARDGTPWSGCDELEPSRQDQRATSPDNRDTALLQRLAQSLQHVPPEFRQLVEEEHAPVSTGNLTGRQDRTAADHPGVRDRVVRSAKRPFGVQFEDRPLPGCQADCGRGQGVGRVERSQQARDGPSEECLAASRRADEQQGVTAGQGDLERPPGDALATHLSQVRHVD
jgi:hypothetical protein